MQPSRQVVRVAVPVPVRQVFDYLVRADDVAPDPGVRVRVPFARRSLIGVVTGVARHSDVAPRQLKFIDEVLDSAPVLPESMLKLLEWASDYYHHPIGEVIHTALPAPLRTRDTADERRIYIWKLTAAGAVADAKAQALKRALVQQRVLRALQAAPAGLDARALAAISARWRPAVEALVERGWASASEREPADIADVPGATPPPLSEAQARAVTTVLGARGFAPFLLYGVTGSGKTEVYLRVIEKILERGDQVLVLVPEIALTPQLVTRFRDRFHLSIAVLHSDLTDQERAKAWLAASAGKVQIVIGTRSAVFTPLPRLGVIVVDEEHDASYKQQEGFRYSARDVAVMRAHRENVPLILGSATPSLESLNRARTGNYTALVLPARAGGASMPSVELLDMRRLVRDEGISHPLRTAISETLQRKEQVLLFLNRRGYAPIWMCFACGWVAPCRRCDARLTFHRTSTRLRCHHCGSEQEPPQICPDCGAAGLHALGEGTERVEAALTRLFPRATVVRVDRDSTRAKGSLQHKLEQAQRGDAHILVGTQMLSKGHDFPNVTLVGVLNADQGLYGSDFRAPERLVQQIIQVSGRAGRAAKAGQVLIQTYHPSHPVFAALQQHSYNAFADYALAERRQTSYPPFSHLALLRAESTKATAALEFLRGVRAEGSRRARGTEVQVMEPVPSPMERRAGRYRAQLLIQSPERGPLHAVVAAMLDTLAARKVGRSVRWSIDVDPIDLY